MVLNCLRKNSSRTRCLLNRTDFYGFYSRLPLFIWEIRTAVMVKKLLCEQKPGLNVVDRYAMVLKKDSCIIVGHLPQKIEEVR